jgi:hypothetical protein
MADDVKADVNAEGGNTESTDSKASLDQESNTQDQGGAISEGGVDYKAEYEKATKQLSKAEHKLEETRKKKESGGDGKLDPADIEKLAVERAEAIAKEKISEFSSGLVKDIVSEGLSMFSSNEDERRLIQHHYDNTIQKSGQTRADIMNDLRRAKLLANENATGVQIDELTAALRSEQGKNKIGQAAGERKNLAQRIVLTPSEETLAQRMYERASKTGKKNQFGKAYQLEDARRELFEAKGDE